MLDIINIKDLPKQLNILELAMIISFSNKVKSNIDIIEIIFKFYKREKPKFRVQEMCIRVFYQPLNYTYKSNKNKKEEQAVVIDNIYWDKVNKYHIYSYVYYENNKGWCRENQIRKLTKKEKESCIISQSMFTLPMDRSNFGNWIRESILSYYNL